MNSVNNSTSNAQLEVLSKQIDGLISDSEINGTSNGQDELITDLEVIT